MEKPAAAVSALKCPASPTRLPDGAQAMSKSPGRALEADCGLAGLQPGAISPSQEMFVRYVGV
jgi:hypothetical protein